MNVERTPGGYSLVDVLDRVLDKGIVIDAWVRVALVGIDLITIEARVVVSSIDTYLRYAQAIGALGNVATPRVVSPQAHEALAAENAALCSLLAQGVATRAARAPRPRRRPPGTP